MKTLLMTVLVVLLASCTVLNQNEPIEDAVEEIVIDEEFSAIYALFLATTTEIVSYDEWLLSIKGADGLDGADGRSTEFNVSDTHLQWRYIGESTWRNMISLSMLTGPMGPAGPAGQTGSSGSSGPSGATGAQGPQGIQGPQGVQGPAGSDGVFVVFDYTSGIAQWRYSNEDTFQPYDSAINPGNSGGPVFNLSGEIVGINFLKSIFTNIGVPLEGMGYSISADVAERVATAILQSGTVVRGDMGLTVQDVRSSELGFTSGVQITTVNNPTIASGLAVNDVIIAIDTVGDSIVTTAIRTPIQLLDYLLFKHPGDQLRIFFYRDGVIEDVVITLGTLAG